VSLAGKVVEWGDLLKVVYSALAAGLGVALAFSLAVAGATKFADEMRDSNRPRAVAFGAVGALGLAVCIAAIVFGIVVMTQKS
jgi:amino acid transporter